MAIDIQKEVAGITFLVHKLTIREIYELFARADVPRDPSEEPDWIGNVLFEDVTLQDVLTFTDLNRERLLEMLPGDVEAVISEVKRENPHFFAACRRLEEAGKRLDAVITSKPSDGSSAPSLP
ncbi:hypothetical protein [Magnetofaba australis]|uniref:hypothetical protein n=1 Tax=Magnetofaba australis TaxID=1472297 RepID=UPI000A19D994|nr:hypothetical protein [Magnetofaba australis]